MSAVALTGNDAININGRIISDFPSGDVGVLEFPNDIASLKTGKNGNAIYSLNETGEQADLKIRLVRGSSDDKFMNALLVQQRQNFAGFILMSGEFVKKIGDGAGNVLKDTYIMGGGIFTKKPGTKSNAEGDVEQSVIEYMIKFANAPRAMT